MTPDQKVAVIGGTGHLGAAIALRLARAGCAVVIGSRTKDSAEATAHDIGHGAIGLGNADAAHWADILIVAVPFAAQEGVLEEIRAGARGKIVVDTTVPLAPPRVMRVHIPAEGSAAVRAQSILGSDVTVVSAFHNVAAHKLATDEAVQCDVLVFGDDKAARSRAAELVEMTGLRAIHGGALCNSIAAEAMTSVLIFVNKTYRVDGAGLAVTGALVALVD